MTTLNDLGLFDPNARPDVDLMQREWDYYSKVWEPGLAAKKKVDLFYAQKNDIWEEYHRANPLAPQRPQYHSGRAVALIDHAVDAHLAFHPRFHREPRGMSTKDAEAADRIEKGLAGAFADAFLWQPNIPTKVNGKQLVLHNHTQLYIGLDHDALERPLRKQGEDTEDFERREWEWESRHLTYNPIRLEVPAPGEVMMNPLEVVPKLAIRRRRMRAYELHHLTMTKARTGAGEIWDMGRHDPYDEIEITERWTSRWVAVFKDGDMLYLEPNDWWVVPFAQIWGGTATTPTKEDFDPADWVKQSLTFRVMDALQYRDQSFVAQHEVLMRTAYAKQGYSGEATEGVEQMQGDLLTGSKDDWWVMPMPQFPSDLLQEKKELDNDLEQATYSLQAAGFRQSGVDTATQQVILSEMTNRTFKANVVKMEALYSIAGSHAMRLMYRMSKDYPDEFHVITTGDGELRVADLGEPPRFDIVATFEQIDPVAAMQELQSALTLYERGLVDRDYIWRVARIEDPSSIRHGLYRDALQNDPDIIEQGVINALREEGMLELADRRQAELDRRKIQRIAAGGQQNAPQGGINPPGGVTPPNPPTSPLSGRVPNLGG